MRVLGMNRVRDFSLFFVLNQPIELQLCRRFDPMRFWVSAGWSLRPGFNCWQPVCPRENRRRRHLPIWGDFVPGRLLAQRGGGLRSG